MRDVSSVNYTPGISWKGSGIIRSKDYMSKIYFFHYLVDAGGISQSILAKAFPMRSSCPPAQMPYQLLSTQSLRKVSRDEISFPRIELIFDLRKCPLQDLLTMKHSSRSELFLEKRGSIKQFFALELPPVSLLPIHPFTIYPPSSQPPIFTNVCSSWM